MNRLIIGVCTALVVGASACSNSPTPNTTAPLNTVAPNATASSDTGPRDTGPRDTSPNNTTGPAVDPQVKLSKIAAVPGALDIASRSSDNTQFVVSRDGFIAAIRDGVLADDHVLDISGLIVSGNEQGLLGLAFAPDGNHAYVDYTRPNGDTVIAEFAVQADGVFVASSRREILTIPQPYPNHNGGAIRIGPDGLLYIGMGDGGASGDPDRKALDKGDLLGKILRIDPTPSGAKPYTIPPDNPFVGVKGARAEIWSIGVRNPWRINFDRTNGDLWIADVGQDAWEEIDFASAAAGAGRGDNFGWSAFEGTHRFNTDQSADGVTMPIYEYPHGDLGCSISGGVRYRGTKIPALVGWYVFGDYCSGQLRALQVKDNGTAGRVVDLADNISGLTSIGQNGNGELFVLSVETGNVIAVLPRSS